MAEVSGKRSGDDGSEMSELSTVFCQLCQIDDKTTKAEGQCRQCEEFMCKPCYDHHRKGKFCRDHEFATVTHYRFSSQGTVLCKKHEHEKIKFYCRQHDFVGCGDCVVLEKHGSCELDYIEDILGEYSNNTDRQLLLEHTGSILDGLTSAAKTFQNNVEINEHMREKAFRDIKSFQQKFNKHLDDKKSDLLSAVRLVAEENKASIAEVERAVNVIDVDISEIKQGLDSNFHNDKAVFINTVLSKPKVKDIEKGLEQLNLQNKIRVFEFKADKELCDFLQCNGNLGHVNVEKAEVEQKSYRVLYEDARQAIAELQKKQDELNKQHRKEKVELENQIKENTQAEACRKTKLKTQEELIEKMKSTNIELERTNNDLQKERTELQQKVASLRATYQQLEKSKAEIEETARKSRNAMKREIDQLKATLSTRDTEIKELRSTQNKTEQMKSRFSVGDRVQDNTLVIGESPLSQFLGTSGTVTEVKSNGDVVLTFNYGIMRTYIAEEAGKCLCVHHLY